MSFSLFANLPAEIQDLIWEFVIPPHRPTAHAVSLNTSRFPGGARVAGKRTKTSLFRDGQRAQNHSLPMADDPEATLNAALTLLKTTSASRAVAKRVSGVSGMELAVLRSPQPPRSTPAPQPPVPSIRVNVAVDMILLNPSWSLHADKNTPLNMDPVYYIGFPAPAMPRSRMRLRGDVKALVRIYNLRVVYAIVEPGELRAAAEVPWPENDVWEMAGWGGGVPATLEGFLSAYDDDRGPLGPFVCGGREYFEIPSEEVRGLGGLQWLIWDLEAMRCEMITLGKLDYGAGGEGGMYSTRHRLMSWREVEMGG